MKKIKEWFSLAKQLAHYISENKQLSKSCQRMHLEIYQLTSKADCLTAELAEIRKERSTLLDTADMILAHAPKGSIPMHEVLTWHGNYRQLRLTLGQQRVMDATVPYQRPRW